ncbi:hypothetical protein EJ06DRAFT_58692 [Trichodelitschia bisporula]|uniref:Uncharacterized protein n=1 Tax=Trichodelitschia bisporula TaxID=703511 RepID=A0A6G1HUS2_9PEZI|nr:hypothetical protein EJ06DRAFT_58692 [Trichodelitschia bisporula]
MRALSSIPSPPLLLSFSLIRQPGGCRSIYRRARPAPLGVAGPAAAALHLGVPARRRLLGAPLAPRPGPQELRPWRGKSLRDPSPSL